MADKLETRYYTLPIVESYMKEIRDYLFESMNSPKATFAPTLKEVTKQLEGIMEIIRQEGKAFDSVTFSAFKRFRSENYNEMAGNLKIDLSVLYDVMNSFVTVITQTAIMMDRTISKLVSKIDFQMSRVRGLESLSNQHVEFDDIIHNSFTSDDNIYPVRDYATINKDLAGIITLNTVNVDNIVKNDDGYDLYLKPITEGALTVINNTSFAAEKFIDSMDFDVIADNQEGAQYAIIVVLPAAKWINNISFSQFSAYALNIDGIYYDDDINSSETSTSWTPIALVTDAFNFRNFNFNFEQIEARSIMIKVTQLKYDIQKVAADMSTRLFKTTRLSFGEAIEEIGKNSSKSVSGAYSIVPSFIRENIDRRIRVFIQNVIDTLNLDAMSYEGEKGNLSIIYRYNIALFNLRIDNNRYQDDNVYRSPVFGGKNDIKAVTLEANDEQPSGTVVNYYLDVNGKEIRFGSGDSATDVITVMDTSIKQYDTELFLDPTLAVVVTRNGATVDPSDYSIRRPYGSANMAYGIVFDNAYTLGLGDFITITYFMASVDRLGYVYEPSMIRLSDVEGKPNLKYQLEKGDLDRIIVKAVDGTYVSYDASNDEAHPFMIPSGNGSDDPYYGYGLQSKKSMTSVTVFPPYISLSAPYVYGISGEYVLPSQRAIYYGIINETISGTGSTTTFNTVNEYLPGSLHVFVSGDPMSVEEYITDTAHPGLEDKSEFTTTLYGNINGMMQISYIPIDDTVSGQVSNIAKQNKTETFFGTDENNTLELEYYVYVDPMIVGGTVSVPQIWREDNGTFVLECNNDVIYVPIEITIKGKTARNLTDYIGTEVTVFTEYSPMRRNYEYYVDGRHVYFNTNIDLDIVVKYYSLPDTLSLMAYLYRTDRSIDTVTPLVYDYSMFIDKV